MLVIFNSDVLYTDDFVHSDSHRWWREFGSKCCQANARVIFPRTALYEIELRQQELLKIEKDRLETSLQLLARHGVNVDSPPVDQIAKLADVPALFRSVGATVDIEEATLEDFRDAERRACLHEPPAPPRKQARGAKEEDQSDEMRDLVILATARRLAAAAGGAILVSRDGVHTSEAAREEAGASQLRIAVNMDEALGILGAETPAGIIANRIIEIAWPKLIEAGLPLPARFSSRPVYDISFTQGNRRMESARFRFVSETDEGARKPLSACVSVTEMDDPKFRFSVESAHVEKSRVCEFQVQVVVEITLPAPHDNFDERIDSLRAIVR
jgi:hypothetical protein